MTLGLAHSLGRFTLKFSPDKVDVMIVQAISLLDDLDKEINVYSMRVKEWYGWHFPELARALSDNIVYARVVRLLKQRSRISQVDLTDVLDENTASVVAKMTNLSMGTDINDEDIQHVVDLADQVIEIYQYREELNEYIRSRMNAIAPNLTMLVGELVGARLIAHAGSLLSLAKCPSSTVQILGAEKALFRALKTRKPTPKYGLLYHASIVGQANGKNKGKISRILANKAALGCRVDALGDENTKRVGIDGLKVITARIMELEGKNIAKTLQKPLTRYEQPNEIKKSRDVAEDFQLGTPEDSKKRKREDEKNEEGKPTKKSKKI